MCTSSVVMLRAAEIERRADRRRRRARSRRSPSRAATATSEESRSHSHAPPSSAHARARAHRRAAASAQRVATAAGIRRATCSARSSASSTRRGSSTGPERLHLGLELDAEALRTRRRPSAISATTSAVVASPWLTMKFACLAEKLGAADPQAAAAGGLEQLPGGAALGARVVGVLERRAERLDPRRLRRLAPRAHLGQRRLDLARARRRAARTTPARRPRRRRRFERR